VAIASEISNTTLSDQAIDYTLAVAHAETADGWMSSAEKRAGSWWPHWLEWITARSGETRPAPATLDSADFLALDVAPGRYVMES
jgi:polyhydroxyalkanoate synthase subunit PhaC